MAEADLKMSMNFTGCVCSPSLRILKTRVCLCVCVCVCVCACVGGVGWAYGKNGWAYGKY